MADNICERLACGESLRSVCRDEKMPAMSTVFKWLRENPEFSEQYAKAKEESADALLEDMLDIADNGANQPLIVEGNIVKDEKGNTIMVRDGPSVQHARLRVDVRKWAASKMKPKKYGDRPSKEEEESNDIADVLSKLIDKLPQ